MSNNLGVKCDKCGREDLPIRHFPAHGYGLCFYECECQDCEEPTCCRIYTVEADEWEVSDVLGDDLTPEDIEALCVAAADRAMADCVMTIGKVE